MSTSPIRKSRHSRRAHRRSRRTLRPSGAKRLAIEPLEERRLLFTGGNVFVTGHDVLYHGGQRGFDTVALDFLRGVGTPAEIAKSDYSLAVIGSGVGSWSFSEGGQTKPGYERTTLYNTSALANDPALWDAVLEHDALIVNSHETCGGCDVTTEGSNVINANAEQIRLAMRRGMDVYAESGAHLTTFYDFLPDGLVGGSAEIGGSSGVTLTPEGQAIGLTSQMANGNPFHNQFHDLSSEMIVFGTLDGAILTAGVRGRLFQEVSGNVFHDADEDGVRDAAESGVAGIQVRLLDDQFSPIGAEITDVEGAYDLTRWITAPGTYYVELAPSSVNVSPQDAGGDDALDSDVDLVTRRSDPLVVVEADDNQPLIIDAGLYGSPGTATVVANAWRDANDDGIRDAGESPLSGVAVELLNAAGGPIASGVTAADGTLQFDQLAAGNYRLRFTAPAEFVVGASDAGFDDDVDSDANTTTGTTATFALLGGQHDASRAAGFVRVYEIGGLIWDDENADGLQTAGEAGLPGVEMRLFSGAVQIASTTTDVSGDYRFANLRPGDYRVEVRATSGSQYSPTNVGVDDAVDSDFDDSSRDALVTLPTAQGNARLDGGLVPVRLAITEFMAINRSTLQNALGEFSDWIEITNIGNIAADLEGWHLTDKADNLTKFQLEEQSLAPGESIVVYASERCCPPGEIHANFRLSASGEYLALVEPDGVTVASEFSPTFPQQMPDVSYGRGAGGGLLYFPAPTPGAPNGEGLATIPFNLVITEFMAENQSTLLDDDGDYADWVEIFNAGVTPITLDGWHLTDSPWDLALWTFPNVALDPGEYIVVFASGNNRRDADQPLHTSFKLSSDGEYLALVEPDGVTVVSEFNFDEQEVDVSYGLSPDLQRQRAFPQPTPGAANQAAFLDVTFSVQRGFFDAPQIVALASETAGAEIRYTTDGSAPSSTTGTVYAGPIIVDTTTTLRAAAFTPTQVESSPVFTQTYIFLDDVLLQDGAGFPQSWGFASDYEVDGEIVGSPAYHADLLAGLRALPSVSLVADRDDLFSVQNGIYANPNQSGPNWIPPASVEWLVPQASSGNFQASAAVRIDNTVGSVFPPDTPKLSLRLMFDAPHGEGPLRQTLFGGDGPDRIDSLLLHPGYEDSWIHPDGSLRDAAQFRRDAWLRDMQSAMGQTALADRFVHVYINGLYWGLYNLIQPPTAAAAADRLGENVEYDIVGESETIAGDRAAWDTMVALAGADLSNAARYDALRQHLDVENLADFVVLSTFAGRPAHDANGWYAVRPRQTGGAFQFWIWDGEDVLSDAAFGDELLMPTPGMTGPYELFDHLRASPEFRQLFADRVAKHLSDRGALADAAAIEAFTDLDLDKAVVAESARWGDYRRDAHQAATGPYELYTRNDHWRGEKTRIVDTFLAGRAAATVAFFQSLGLYPTVDPPELNQYGGAIEPGFELSILAGDGSVFYTLDGSDPRLTGGGISPAALVYDAALPISQSVQVRARARSGNQWSAVTEATFLVAGGTTLELTEIMFHPSAATADEIAAGFAEDDLFEFIEFKNTGNQPIVLDGMTLTGGIEFDFASGDVHVLAPEEHVLVVKNRAAFDERYGAGNRIAGQFDGNLGNGGDYFALLGPFVEYILNHGYGDGDPLTDGQGFSILPQTGLHSAFFGGSPGEDDPQLPANAVVVNEISPSGDWVELFNRTNAEIDLGGWYISDDPLDLQRSRIPPGTSIAANDYFVLHSGPHFTFGLNRRGETVTLSSGRDGELGGYRNVAPYERGEPGVNFGRYEASDGGVEFVRLSAHTEGEANASPLVGPIVINEIMYHPTDGELEYIELYNASDADLPLDGWRLTAVGYAFEPGATIHARDYLLVVPVDPAEFIARYDVGSAHVEGPYLQSLAGRGESVTLYQPDDTGEIRHDRVVYGDEAPWSALADGYGAALGRISETAFGNDPASWTATAVGGTPGRPNDSLAADPRVAPYEQDFETGSLATLAGWNFAVTDTAVWNLSAVAPHGGAVHLVASQSTGDDVRHEAVLLLDLTDQSAATDLVLDFWARRSGGEEGNIAEVQISGDGRSWSMLGQVLPAVDAYTHFAFDLDQALADAGVEFDADVFVRFVHEGTTAAHAFALDDIRVGNRDLFGPNVIAQIPSGVASGPLSQIVVAFDDPILPATFTPEDVVITTPDGMRIIPTAVVAAADLRSWTIEFAPQTLRGTYRIALGPELTDTAGNPMSQGGATVDGMAVNRNPYFGSLTLGPATARTFPYTDDFESGDLASLDGWSFATSDAGTWEIAPGGSGLFQLKSDQTSFGPSTKEAVLLLDLADQAASDALMIDFHLTRLGHLSRNLVSLAVSGDGQSWRHVHSMSPPLAERTYFAFDLDAALTRFGIAADEDVYLRFRHDGRFANDEALLDDLRVSDIDVFGPRVVSFTPSSIVAAPLASLTVTFDEPVDPATFSAADVVVTGPLGNVVPLASDPLASADQRTFTLDLAAPQTLNGAYSVRIGSDIRDAVGNPLNQDGDPTNGETNGHDDFVTTVRVGPPQSQTFPHEEGFETGAIGDLVGWQLATTGSGTVAVTDENSPYDGTYHLWLGQDDPGPSRQEAALALDLSTVDAGAYLSFYARVPTGASAANKTRLLASGDGLEWFWLADLNPERGQNAFLAFDLGTLLADVGIALDSDVFVQFVHSGVSQTDAFAIDQLLVSSEKPFGPRIVSQTPLAYDGAIARFTVTFDEPIDAATFTPSDVELELFGDVISPQSIDSLDNRTFTLTLSAALVAGRYDLRIGPDIANLRGIPMNQDADAVNGELNGEDTYTASLVVVDRPQSVPYFQDFESGTVLSLSGWSFSAVSQFGVNRPERWRVESDMGPFEGSYHLLTNQPGDCWSNHFAILALDMSQHAGATDLVLDFYLKRDSTPPDKNIRNMAKLLVSGDGATFTQVGTPLELLNADGAQRFGDLDPGDAGQAGGDGVIDLVPATGVYTRYTFDLDELLAAAGVAVGGTVYIDFHQLSFYKYNIVMFDNVHIYRTSGTDETSPQVVDVSVSGEDWTVPFTQYLTTGEMGTFSFSIPSGTDQLMPLTWGSVDQLRLRFSEDVVVTSDSLSVYGINTLDYTPTIESFTYEPTSRTAVWTFASPFPADKLLLVLDDGVTDRAGNALDGEWLGTSDVMPSGDGAAGGSFSFRINVLPGDLDRDGQVSMLDHVDVENRLGTTANTPDYSALADYDGNGLTTDSDRLSVFGHVSQTLPSGEPSSLGAPGDVDGDNRVGLADLLVVHRNFGRIGGVDRQSGDLTGDGRVDAADVAAVVQGLGRGTLAAPSAAATDPPAEAAAIVAGPSRHRAMRLVARRAAAVDAAVSHDEIDLTAIRASRELRRQDPLRAARTSTARAIRR